MKHHSKKRPLILGTATRPALILRRNRPVAAWSLQELMCLHQAPWNEVIRCMSIVLLPARKKLHDSGYRCMGFIPITNDDIPICLVGGGSDVLHLGGIGGHMRHYSPPGRDSYEIPWAIDCLPLSGLFRLFAHGHDLEINASVSSAELHVIKREKE